MKKTFLLVFMMIICMNAIARDLFNFSISLINLPFPPYQRNIIRLIETEKGDLYGIISQSPFNKGKIIIIEGTDKIHERERLPDDILQVDSIIFNPDLTWTWDRSFKKIITLNNSGVLEIYEGNGPGKQIMKISGTRPFEPQGYQISRSFALDKTGNLYTVGKDGFLFKFDPETQKIEKLNIRLPSVRGREPWASLDASALADDGTIFLGTFDGYIAQFNPETQTIVNLGKPLRQQRIQTLIFFKKNLFGIGGEPDGLPRWFIYNPETRGFQLGGTLKDEKNRLIYEFVNTAILKKDGTIIGSFSGRLGSLFKIETGK